MTLHTALNLSWLCISACAFVWFWCGESRRRSPGRWLRFLAVCALCITVFPSVSDSDDLFTFSLMPMPGHRHGGVGSAPPPEGSREKSTLHLARLLETLDHYQISSVCAVTLTVLFIALSLMMRPAWETRSLFSSAGRAPPAA